MRLAHSTPRCLVTRVSAKRRSTQRGLQQSPTEAAFLQKLPLNKAPTPYARTLPSEAFAESYRLWKSRR